MKALQIFILVLFFSATAVGQTQASASFSASVTIVEPIGITNTANLNFASVDAEKGGLVVLTPSGDRITKGGAALADGNSVSAAVFQVTGQSGLTYSISLPQGEHFLTSGGNQVVLSDFTSNLGETGKLQDNSSELRVGATVKFTPGQSPGKYSSIAPLAVTVNYN